MQIDRLREEFLAVQGLLGGELGVIQVFVLLIKLIGLDEQLIQPFLPEDQQPVTLGHILSEFSVKQGIYPVEAFQEVILGSGQQSLRGHLHHGL